MVLYREALGQMRFLFGHFNTEFAGCLYGRLGHDTVYVSLFVPGLIDPRQASDSTVVQGDCMRIKGLPLVGIAHSHMRTFSTCFPSVRDMETLAIWTRIATVRLGAIMCAMGDSVAVFGPTSYGVLGLPTLDSLYRHNP